VLRRSTGAWLLRSEAQCGSRGSSRYSIPAPAPAAPPCPAAGALLPRSTLPLSWAHVFLHLFGLSI